MRCDSAFLLGELENVEAKRLFEKMVGGKVKVGWEPLVEEALGICAGLPFLIVAISKLFIDTTYSACKCALTQIWSKDTGETGELINKTLQISYERIKRKEAKSLLQLIAVYGVSKPSLENLVRYGFGLGLLGENSSMEDARNMLSLLIEDLQDSSLLLRSEEGDGFKIHDLVREFVASIISKDRPLLVLKDQSVAKLSQDKLQSCEAICFPYVDMKKLPQKLVCPELRIFLLFANDKSLEVPDSYFNFMRKLKVLNFTGICLSRLPLPFQFLENLRTLCMDNCSLEDVAILAELKGLEILSLRGSKIQRLPKEIGQLVELRLLDLSHCYQLEIIEPDVLGRLTKLEELYMECSFDKWNAVEQTPATNASLIELNNMKKLRTLHVSIRDPSVLPKDLDVEKLTKYRISIGNVWCWSEYEGLRTLNLELNSNSDILREKCIQSVLRKTDGLFLQDLNGIEQSICRLSQERFSQLKHLQVEGSSSLHYILDCSSLPTFKALESLLLKRLINLEKIYHNHISTESFRALKVVRVEGCDKMKVLFPRSVVRQLPHLEKIEVVDCKLMRGIVDVDDDRGKFELPKLRVLKLRDLPNIQNFITAGSSPLSRTLDDHVGTQIAFFNGRLVAFSSLETLEVDGLGNPGFMFSPSMVKSLAQPRILKIGDCKKMEAIITEEEGLGVEISETLAFPMLTDLSLTRLESLTCFSHEKCSQEDRSLDRVQSCSSVLFNREVAFPRLELLDIDGLDNLGFMLFPSMVKSLAQLRNLSIRHCKKMEAVIMEEEGLGMETSKTPAFSMLTNLSLEHLKSLTCFSHGSRETRSQNRVKSRSSALFNQEVALPSLEKLCITGLDNIQMIWDNQVVAESFPKLKLLSEDECNKLVTVVPSFVLGRLKSLESLVAKACVSLEVVFELQPLLPLDGHPVALPLRELTVSGLPKLKCVWDKELHRQVKFQRLRYVSISKCSGLTSLFPASVTRDLIQLEELVIHECGNCRILTEVISYKGSKEDHEVAFHHLKCVELDGLVELKCFSSGGCALIFPLLEDVIVNRCPNMKFFSEGPIEAPKLERVKVDRAGFWKGNLKMTIQNMFKEMATVAKAEFVRLFEFPELVGKWHNEHNPVNSSWQLKTLVVDKCPSFINAMPSKLMLVLEKMTSLQVRNCESLEEIFDLKGLEAMESTRVLPRLRELNFIGLPKLRQLWNKDLQGTRRFNALSSLILYKCSNLTHAFTPSMAWCLANLEYMEIKECDQMEGVIEEKEGQGSAMEKIMFPRLGRMILESLPNLTSFLSGKNHVLNCPKLYYPRIAHCPKMRSLTWQSSMDIDHNTPSLFTPQVQFLGLRHMVLSHMDNLSKIWPDNPQETLTFGSLMKVKTKNCESLENLFPHWVATSLTQLEKLRVESCRIEEIVANGDNTRHSNIARVLFPKLTSLVLHDMPQLKTFCPNLPTLNWQFLKELRVTHCDKLNMLSFAASMSKWTRRDDQQDLSNQEAHSSFERDFSNLERLLLVAKDIQMIQNGKFPDDIFGKPKALTLACFHDEKATFPPSFLLERFQNMESLEIFRSSFEDIFPVGGIVDEGKHPVLESLRKLKLSKLHKLKRVWREDCLVSKILLSIKTLEVRDCPELTVLFPAVTSFWNLTELVVNNSSRLATLSSTHHIGSRLHPCKGFFARAEHGFCSSSSLLERRRKRDAGYGTAESRQSIRTLLHTSFLRLWPVKIKELSTQACGLLLCPYESIRERNKSV
ncbi:uncharacterized protein LOC115745815 [Rhodamnia argentea]|uniref:Uncharacterized protein LOC115745815 n=1 Tax=Rhodamnia argentea TaxID=178133 RepID=A0ABM3HGP4_9MYRT|nr:uncharacterized protein LOC115745815 [Rhodamnia argentea]